MIRRLAPPALALAVAFTLVACGGGSSSKSGSTPSSGNGEPKLVDVVHSGDAGLDHTLNAAVTPDPIELARLVRYERVTCAEQAGAEHPVCREGTKPGDEVDAFPRTGCDPSWVYPEAVPGMFKDALGSEPKFLAIYTPAEGVDAYGAGYIGIIGVAKHPDGTDGAVALHVKDGRIMTLEDDCGGSLKLLDSSRVKDWVVQPGQTSPSAGTATP